MSRLAPPEALVIRAPDDMHVHLREGAALAGYAADAARQFARILVMPNTHPPVWSPGDLAAYREGIAAAAPGLDLVMTFKVRAGMDAATVRALRDSGARAGKLYPQGATTNSGDGLASVDAAYPVFEAMEECGLALCIHGEEPSAPALEREEAFLPEVEGILRRFPRLKVVLEHVSSAAGIAFVREASGNLAATVTVHHLLYTTEDLLGGKLDVHLFCRPLLKGARDRAAIQEAVLAGDRRLFFGSDSAPHPLADKQSGAAGVYSMPVSLPLLAAFFVDHDAAGRLEDFVSRFGAEFYGLPLNEGRVRILRRAWRVPDELHGVVPLAAGRELQWRVEEDPASLTGPHYVDRREP